VRRSSRTRPGLDTASIINGGATTSAPPRRRRSYRLLAWTLGAAFALVGFSQAFHVSDAGALPSITCSGSNPGTNGVLDVIVGGTPDSTDVLIVAVVGGDYSLSVTEGSASSSVCTGLTLPAGGTSGFPTVEITGASVPTTFRPGTTTTNVDFIGQSGAANTIDLSSESASDFNSITVTMSSSVCTGGGQFSTTGGSPDITDAFCNVAVIDSATSVPTTFEPDPTLSATPSSPPVFVGLDSAPGGSVLDLSGIVTPDSNGFTLAGVTASMNEDTAAVPGVVSAAVAGSAVQFASFSGIDEVLGSPGGTVFQPGTAISTAFDGQPGASNVIDLATEAAGNTVQLDGPSTSCPSGDELATIEISAGTDSSCSIKTFVGSSQGSNTFESDGYGGHTFQGSGASNTLDLSNAPAGLVVSPTGVTLTGGSDTFSGIQGFVGSHQGSTTFVASGVGGGISFRGEGSGNKLDLSALPPNATVDEQTGVASFSTSAADTFSSISCFVGSSSGSTTFVAAPGSHSSAGCGPESFTGQGSSNELDLSSIDATTQTQLVVDIGAGTASGPGTTLTFGGISTFVGSSLGFTTFRPDASHSYDIQGLGSGNTLDLSKASSSVTLDLGRTTPQATGGAGTLTIAAGSIQTVIGSNFGNHLSAGPGTVTLRGGAGTDLLQAGSGTDTLIAGSGPSTLVGGAGYDAMTGGAGADLFKPGSGGGSITDSSGVGTLDCAEAASSVDVNLGTKPYTVTPGVVLAADTLTGGAGAPYALSGIVNVVGSTHGDVLVGSSGANDIQGGSGPNLIVGDGGGDMLVGGSGTNVFITGSGHNVVTGGSGSNTIDYASAPRAVNVDLRAGTAKNGFGGTDSLKNVANVIGSNNNGDVIKLGGHQGTITAGNGSGDALVGSKAGGSTMYGGGGSDTFTSVGPRDHMIGGTGDDTFLANNGFKDYIVGGKGHNVAYVDCTDVRDKTYRHVQVVHVPLHC
jgi:hypothetical protein